MFGDVIVTRDGNTGHIGGVNDYIHPLDPTEHVHQEASGDFTLIAGETSPPTLSGPKVATQPATNPPHLPVAGGKVTLSVTATDNQANDTGIASATATVIGPNGPEPVVNLTRVSGDAKSGVWQGEYTAPATNSTTPVPYQVIFHATDGAGNQSAPSETVPFTVGGGPQVVITLAPRGTGGYYHITADGKMPEIWATAQLVGAPSGTPTPTFSWTAKIHFDPRKYDAKAPARTDLDYPLGKPLQGKTKGDARFTPNFALRGGELQITVETKVGSETYQAKSDDQLIIADEPTGAAIRAEIAAQAGKAKLSAFVDTLNRIAAHESKISGVGQHQFLGGLPYWNQVPGDGGCGIFQITPAPVEAVWDWRQNVAAGVAKFRDALASADRFPSNVAKSPGLKALLANLNEKLKADADTAHQPFKAIKAQQVKVAPFTPEQRLHDAIRLFNGAAGTDPITQLGYTHEYTLASDDWNGKKILRLDQSLQTAWVEVTERVTNPDYVEEVLATSPTPRP